MRIAVLGAGAIGCTIGHLLADHGHDVVLIDVWAEHVEAICSGGLTVAGHGEERVLPMRATTDIAAAADAEVVLVLVKSFANEAAARALASVWRPGAIAVTVQNGIGNDARLAAVLGPDAVVQGSTTVGAQMLAAGRVRVVSGTLEGRSRTLLAMPRPQPAAEACTTFAAALNGSGLPTEIVDDVRAVVWRKAAFAAAIGPICATLEGTVADALERPSARAVLRRAFAEIVAVARAEGIDLDLEQLWFQALDTYRSIGPHPPSLAVDVAQGRPTEIESQLGEVCRRAAAHGITTPASDVLTAIVRAREPA